ncbi:MAG: exo-alpha-sialidase [bacterium]|nr:exo-alpha-sialidase [bacterium]
MNVLRILNRNFGIIAFLFTVVMANAYDVLGPYNNSNTMIEYTTFRTGPGQPDHTYLYALNSFDKFRELAGSTYCVFLRNQIDTHSDIWNPLRFHTSGGNPVFDVENFYPTLLGRNLTSWELNDWALSATARRAMYVRNCSRNSGIGGIHWFNAWDASGSGATWYSRLVVSRTNSAIQWLASDNTVHETAGKFSKTLDGWNNGSTLLGTGLPGLLEREYCVYSLGIDDSGLPGGVLRAVCTITHQALPIDGLEDPHLVITECLGEGIYVSDDAGETWEPETPSNWPENAFNVHVAMVPSVAGQPNGDYMVYVLGTEIDGAGDPHVFCKWTEWNSGGTFDTWESSSVEGINEGTAEQPTYPYDLVVEWDPVAEAYMLLAATSEKVYYALHDGVSGDVGWEERMGSGNSAIRTLNFRKIAVDSTARSTNFAVAGESCTYYTADAGETWAPIHNSGRYATTVQGGVQQKLGSENLFALYTRQPYGQNDEFAPVNVQIAPYQDGSSVGRFEKTIQVASTWNNLRNNVILHQSSGGGILFVANPDPLLTDNGINSSGIVRHSEDEGETWTPATWSNMVLSSDEGSAPIPFELTSDPVNPDFVFITFQNADVPGVPPFARSTDGGETWSVPGGLPPAWLNGEPKHLAVGNNNSTAQIVYLYTSDNLYRSIDGGNNWAQLTIPVAAQDAVDIAVM